MFEVKKAVAQPQRIMGKLVGEEVSREQMEAIVGGANRRDEWSCSSMLLGEAYKTDIIE